MEEDPNVDYRLSPRKSGRVPKKRTSMSPPPPPPPRKRKYVKVFFPACFQQITDMIYDIMCIVYLSC